jgi:hypothetical protein
MADGAEHDDLVDVLNASGHVMKQVRRKEGEVVGCDVGRRSGGAVRPW